MTDEIEQQSQPNQKNSGELLRSAREQMQLTVDDVATRLNLRPAIIEAVEQNNHDALPSATFVRGYLRSYARLVGLPEEQVMQTYQGAAAQTSMQSFSNRTSNERSDSRVMWLTYAIVLVLIGFLIVWWWQEQQEPPLELTEATTVEQSFLEQPPIEQPVAEQQITQLPATEQVTPKPSLEEPALSDEVDSADFIAANESAVATEELTAEPATIIDDEERDEALIDELELMPTEASLGAEIEEQASAVPLALVRLTLSKDCWLRIEDATGNVVAEGVKSPGRVVEFTGEPPFNAIFGVPDAVSIEYEGEPYPFEVTNPLKTLRLTFPAE